MAITFRPAVRSGVQLIIGLAGASGSGKTYTAMRLADGIAGGKPFAVIDTEAGRAKHYADMFRFDHADLHPPFRPKAYEEAIRAADEAGYPVIVVDSMSHEWAGEGGILEWREELWAKSNHADNKAMQSWIQPKMAHKSMVQKLLQLRAHVILCFRAEEKVDMGKNPQTGRTEVVPKKGTGGFVGWLPITEKNLPYELTVSLLFDWQKPGVPIPIKLQEQHRALFPTDRPVDEAAGRAVAAWADGAGRRESTEPGQNEPTAASALEELRKAVPGGTHALRAVFDRLPRQIKRELLDQMPELKREAAKHDPEEAMTLDQVLAKLDAGAGNREALDLAADLIEAIPDLGDREKARDAYHGLLEQLQPAS